MARDIDFWGGKEFLLFFFFLSPEQTIRLQGKKLELELGGGMIVSEPHKNPVTAAVDVWPQPYFKVEKIKTQGCLRSDRGARATVSRRDV